MQHIVGGCGFAPDPSRSADIAPPNHLAGFERPTLRPVLLSGVVGREIQRAPKWPMSPEPETLMLPLLVRGRAGGPRTLVCGGTIWSYATDCVPAPMTSECCPCHAHTIDSVTEASRPLFLDCGTIYHLNYDGQTWLFLSSSRNWKRIFYSDLVIA